MSWDERYERLHFVGVGGCGMSGLALVARALGSEVTGSDVKESIFTRSLVKYGVPVTIGHHAENVPLGSVVVYSSAVPPSNVERTVANARGQREVHRSGLLAEMTKEKKTIAVCGAHGKTTTAALLGHVLQQCGLGPSYIIGGLPRAPMAHAHVGKGNLLVIEADESDRSLVNYQADVVAITNIDLDHIRDGGYRSKEDVARVIERLAKRASDVVAPEGVATYMPDVAILRSDPDAFVAVDQISVDGTVYPIHSPGHHQAQNAAVVIKVARLLGCSVESIRAALETFPGLARRFEVVGWTTSGATVVDDYAHHPMEISVTIAAARELANGRVFVVFQPHLYSRTLHFAKEFGEVLAAADGVYVEEIYPSRETSVDWPGVSRSLIIEAAMELGAIGVQAAPERGEIIRRLRDEAKKDDYVLCLGAGDVGEVAQAIVAGK